jgi:NAD(P)-dependent dehydrogenase (short-subunit alcohol dehydrogenase family)
VASSAAANLDEEAIVRYEAAIRETMRADRPLKREGSADDVAEAALYLAGERSRYVTGVVLPVDGGTVAGKAIRRRSDQAR